MLSLSDIVNVKVGIGRGVFEAPGATVIGGKKPSFNLEILKLFANGEQGFYQDPNDLSTMYQDAAGTTPVTAVGQPVGLLLDKSKGLVLGSELVTNGDFANGSAGWTLTNGSSVTSSALVLSNQYATADQSHNVLNGDLIELSYSVVEVSGTPALFVSGGSYAGSAVTINSSLGTHKVRLRVTDATKPLRLVQNNAGVTLKLDNISVKKVLGNHAYQTTSAARPILRDAPRRIDFDAVDDKLITSLPAQLTGCTVIRSVPNVGTQILTNQTIPATYEDNKDHCGLIVINRALTPSETSAITTEFNKRAGV